MFFSRAPGFSDEVPRSCWNTPKLEHYQEGSVVLPSLRSVSKYYGSLCDVSEAAVVGEDEDIRSSEFDDGSSSDQSEETPLLATSTKWTVRQWKILILMLVATCASSFAVCLFPPFFPRCVK